MQERYSADAVVEAVRRVGEHEKFVDAMLNEHGVSKQIIEIAQKFAASMSGVVATEVVKIIDQAFREEDPTRGESFLTHGVINATGQAFEVSLLRGVMVGLLMQESSAQTEAALMRVVVSAGKQGESDRRVLFDEATEFHNHVHEECAIGVTADQLVGDEDSFEVVVSFEGAERRYSADEVRAIAYQTAGAATVPLLEDHPNYVFPSERVKEQVESMLGHHGLRAEEAEEVAA